MAILTTSRNTYDVGGGVAVGYPSSTPLGTIMVKIMVGRRYWENARENGRGEREQAKERSTGARGKGEIAGRAGALRFHGFLTAFLFLLTRV